MGSASSSGRGPHQNQIHNQGGRDVRAALLMEMQAQGQPQGRPQGREFITCEKLQRRTIQKKCLSGRCAQGAPRTIGTDPGQILPYPLLVVLLIYGSCRTSLVYAYALPNTPIYKSLFNCLPQARRP
jgi:hypothetical protein